MINFNSNVHERGIFGGAGFVIMNPSGILLATGGVIVFDKAVLIV